MDTSETDGLVDRVEAVPQKQRKQRADKGSRRRAPKTENGLGLSSKDTKLPQ